MYMILHWWFLTQHIKLYQELESHHYNNLALFADLATVTVNVVSDTTLRVSWVEPSSLTHLLSDTYTVTVTPNCKNDQTGPVAPAPQTVAYNAGPVTVNSLGT